MTLLDELIEMSPFMSAQDWLPEMLQRDLPDTVRVVTNLEDAPLDEAPIVLVTEGPSVGNWSSELHHVDVIDLDINAVASGLDAKSEAFYLASAVMGLLEGYAKRRVVILDGAANIAGFRVWDRPHRKTDWADTTGPVQYQDLPQGAERFLLSCRLSIHYH